MTGSLTVMLSAFASRSCWAFLDQPPQVGTCATSRRDTAPGALCMDQKAMTHRAVAVQALLPARFLRMRLFKTRHTSQECFGAGCVWRKVCATG